MTGAGAALLAGFLASLPERLKDTARDRGPFVARVIRDLVAEALVSAAAPADATAIRSDALVSRVRAFIDGHLDQPLEVERLCAAAGVSRSTLYRAFGGGGGVLQQVLRRRLHAMRLALDDAGDQRSIAQIAQAVGFADKSHAARVFKREFGFTPGDYRRRGADGIWNPAREEDVPEVFERFTALLD